MWLHTINIYDTRYLTSLSKQHPLNCTTENASGSLGLKKNHGIQESVGLGSLPSLSWAWTRSSACALYLSLSEWMPKREMLDP